MSLALASLRSSAARALPLASLLFATGGVRPVLAAPAATPVAPARATPAPDGKAAAGGTTVPVSYTGTVPDPFREGREIIVTVQKQGAGFVGERDSLITKCPSKYRNAPAGEKQNY